MMDTVRFAFLRADGKPDPSRGRVDVLGEFSKIVNFSDYIRASVAVDRAAYPWLLVQRGDRFRANDEWFDVTGFTATKNVLTVHGKVA